MQCEQFKPPAGNKVRELAIGYINGNLDAYQGPITIPNTWYFPGETVADLTQINPWSLPTLIDQTGVVYVPTDQLYILSPQTEIEYIPALTGKEFADYAAITTSKAAHVQGIAHPAVQAILLDRRSGQILVLSRGDATDELPVNNFPGGHVGLESLWEAMLREIEEETSGVINQLNYLGSGAIHCRWTSKIGPDGGILDNREVVHMGVFGVEINIQAINKAIQHDPNAEACEARLVSTANLLSMMNGQDTNARFLRHGLVFRQQFLELFRLGVANMC